MEKQTVVTCVYAEEGGNAAEIIEKSFCLFLRKELRALGFGSEDDCCSPV